MREIMAFQMSNCKGLGTYAMGKDAFEQRA
jgi:hypothetical protein